MLGAEVLAGLSAAERALVEDARTPEALFGLLHASPSLSDAGIRREVMMALLRPALSDRFLDLRSARRGGGFGALLGAPSCAAHAVAACIELLRASATGAFVPLSTRFLDERLRARRSEAGAPQPGGCGEIPPGERAAKLAEAARILEDEGICPRALWDDRQAAPGQPIPPEARQAARGLRCRTAYDEDRPDPDQRRAGLARRIHAELREGRPVAIALPGFRDGSVAIGPTSWDRDEVWYNGNLPDPRPTDVPVPASGHAVCVIGFQPAPSRPDGGYFVFRNSWGRFFAEAPGDDDDLEAPPRTPWQGYGTVSAAHVEALCWEAVSFDLAT
jgi:hypothetical protein